jgi:hypothetical protein
MLLQSFGITCNTLRLRSASYAPMPIQIRLDLHIRRPCWMLFLLLLLLLLLLLKGCPMNCICKCQSNSVSWAGCWRIQGDHVSTHSSPMSGTRAGPSTAFGNAEATRPLGQDAGRSRATTCRPIAAQAAAQGLAREPQLEMPKQRVVVGRVLDDPGEPRVGPAQGAAQGLAQGLAHESTF